MSVGLLTALSLLTVVRRITRQGFLLGQKPLLALKKAFHRVYMHVTNNLLISVLF